MRVAPAIEISPLFSRLLAKRGLIDPLEIDTFLRSDLKDLEDPFLMKGMKEAVLRIQEALRRREKIMIHGDYDVDGITGAAILTRTLNILGADHFAFLPERTKDGYGVSEAALREAHQKGVTLVITVDCGISAREEITVARSLGLDVIVIDHHRLPAEGLPPATVILNPLQENCAYPFKELSAGGLAFKLSQALVGDRAFALLDLTALSTVCDVAPLKGENRILVKHGLEVLSKRTNPGIKALAEIAGLKSREMNTGHIGFVLGPRINAAGRMSSAEIALRLLLTDHIKEAESLAAVLNEENKTRQREEREMVKEAICEVERTVNFNRDRVIVVGREGWHAGVIGIVASRLAEKYYRPAVVAAFEKGIGKASGRSVKNFHLFHAFEACREDLAEFGGHAQAAGLSIHQEKFNSFRTRINQHAREYPAETFIREIPIDLELKLEDLGPHFIRELALLEPLGAGNPRPVFLTRALRMRTQGQGGAFASTPSSRRFWVTDGALTYQAEWRPKEGEQGRLQSAPTFDLIYSIKTSVWDGIESLTLEVKEVKPQL